MDEVVRQSKGSTKLWRSGYLKVLEGQQDLEGPCHFSDQRVRGLQILNQAYSTILI